VYDTSALAEVAFKENTLTSALPIKETVAQCLTMVGSDLRGSKDSGFHISRPSRYFLTQMLFFRNKTALMNLLNTGNYLT